MKKKCLSVHPLHRLRPKKVSWETFTEKTEPSTTTVKSAMITKSISSPTKPVETEERYSENSIQPPKAPKAWSRGQYARHPDRAKARKPVQPSSRMIQDPWKNAISQKEIQNLQPIKARPDSKNQPAGYDFNQVLLIISIFGSFFSV